MSKRKMPRQAITIAGVTIQPGERKLLEMHAASLYAQIPVNIPVHVLHGEQHGYCIFIMAAVHGNEINGVEIIRRLLRHSALNTINGTIIIIPVANVHGFVHLSRDLPDGRDLNRAFPGSRRGSLTARVANLIMDEIISKCTHGIDLHTGGTHLENLPHTRINTAVPGAIQLAHSFNAPIILDAKLRDGSIREAASMQNIPVIVYEGGEALRFSDVAIHVGLQGILNVLSDLSLIKLKKINIKTKVRTNIAYYSAWIRAPKSGIFLPVRKPGDSVKKNELIGFIVDPFVQKEIKINASFYGVIIGKSTLPIVNEGDALLHIAKLKGSKNIASQINELENSVIQQSIFFYE